MKSFKILVITVLIMIPLSSFSYFDGGAPNQSRLMTLYVSQLTKDGSVSDLTDELEYNLRCNINNPYKEGEVSKTSIFGSCKPGQDCKIDVTDLFTIDRSEFAKSCQLAGTVKDKHFVLNQFPSSNIYDFLKENCVQTFQTESYGNYYLYTQPYFSCEEKINNEYYPNGYNNGNGQSICDKFLRKSTTDNNVFYVTDESAACNIQKQSKIQEQCTSLLENVTEKITYKNKPYELMCTARIKVPYLETAEATTTQPIIAKESRFMKIINFFVSLFE